MIEGVFCSYLLSLYKVAFILLYLMKVGGADTSYPFKNNPPKEIDSALVLTLCDLRGFPHYNLLFPSPLKINKFAPKLHNPHRVEKIFGKTE
jgi:hypothetical protein